jgi:hypothetical protein
MPQICQRPLDPSIAPRRVLLRHLDREALDFLRHGWPPQLGAACAPVKLLGDKAAVPAQEGVWCGDGRHPCETCAAKGVGERREATACGVAEV